MPRIPTSLIVPLLLVAFVVYLLRYYANQSHARRHTGAALGQPMFLAATSCIVLTFGYIIVDTVAPDPLYSDIVFGVALLLLLGAALIVIRRPRGEPE